MSKKVTIYTTTTCAYCPMVKNFVKSKGLDYDEVNLDQQPERQAEAYELSGALTVPITVVADEASDDKQIVIGYNLAKLAPALA
jgi:glutaredoxin 3